MSATWGNSEKIYSLGVLPPVTHKRHSAHIGGEAAGGTRHRAAACDTANPTLASGRDPVRLATSKADLEVAPTIVTKARRTWLFAGYDGDGERAVAIQTLVATANSTASIHSNNPLNHQCLLSKFQQKPASSPRAY